MKGARRTRKSRQETGFADLVTPPQRSPSMRGVVTGVSRAQPNASTPNPTTPPPPDEDWGALLQTSPRRRMSPQKPIISTTHASSPSSTTLSPNTPPQNSSLRPSPQKKPSSPTFQPPTPPPEQPTPYVPSPQLDNAPSPSTTTTVPAFLSGWDGADGWGDDPSLDESDPDIDEDAWGAWPEEDDFAPVEQQSLTVTHSAKSNKQAKPIQEEHEKKSRNVEQVPRSNSDQDNGSTSSRSVGRLERSSKLKQGHDISFPEDDSPCHIESSPANVENMQQNHFPSEDQSLHFQNESCDAVGNARSAGDAYVENSISLTYQQVLNDPNRSDVASTQSRPNVPLTAEDHSPSTAEQHLEMRVAPETGNDGDRHKCHIAADNIAVGTNVKISIVDPAKPPTPRTESPQGRHDSTMRAIDPQFGSLENKERSRHGEDDQAGSLEHTQTLHDKEDQKSVHATENEVLRGSAPSAVVEVFNNRKEEPSCAPTHFDAWGFDENREAGHVHEAEWGWGETEDVSTANITHVEATHSSTVVSNESISEAKGMQSEGKHTSPAEDTVTRQAESDAMPIPVEGPLSKSNKNDTEPFQPLQSSPAPAHGWSFDENPREANEDNWGWEAPGDQHDAQFMLGVEPDKSKIDNSISDPVTISSSTSDHATEIPLIERFLQRSNDAEDKFEHGDDTTRDSTTNDAKDQPSLNVRNEAYHASTTMSFEWGSATAVGSDGSQNEKGKGINSFHTVPDMSNQEKAHGKTVSNEGSSTVMQQEILDEVGLRHNDSFGTMEGNACGDDVRSTDVDVSSTIAGTDVPSVATPSSVDDIESEPDRNDLILNNPTTSAIGQLSEQEQEKFTARDDGNSLFWDASNSRTQNHRAWAEPDAQWSSMHENSQTPVTSENDPGQGADHKQIMPTGNKYLSSATRFSQAGSSVEKVIMKEKADLSSTTPMVNTSCTSSFTKGTSAYANTEIGKVAPVGEKDCVVHTPSHPASYVSTQAQQTDVHGSNTKNRAIAEEAEFRQIEHQRRVAVGTQSVLMSVSENTFSSHSPTIHTSNEYWSERLDQSTSPERQSSNGGLPLGPSYSLNTESKVGKTETSLSPLYDLKVASDPINENDTTPAAQNKDLRAPDLKNLEHSLAPVPDTTEELQQLPIHEFGSQLKPESGSTPNSIENSAWNSASSALETTSNSPGWDVNCKTDEERAGNESAQSNCTQSTQVTQALVWPTETTSLHEDDSSNFFESKKERHEGEGGQDVALDERSDKDPVLEPADSLQSDSNSAFEWNRYAPRRSLRHSERSSPDLHANIDSSVRTIHEDGDLKQKTTAEAEVSHQDRTTYDPFAPSHEDATTEEIQESFDAFDWTVNEAEASGHAKVSLQTYSPAERSTVEETEQSEVPREISDETEKSMLEQVDSIQTHSRGPSTQKLQGTQVSATTAPKLQHAFVERDLHSSIAEERVGPLNIQLGKLNESYDVEQDRLKSTSQGTNDELPFSASNPPTSQGEVVGLRQYAPRGTQAPAQGIGVFVKDPGSPVGREVLHTSTAGEHNAYVSNTGASTAAQVPDAPFQESVIAMYKPLSTQASTKHEDGGGRPPLERTLPSQTFERNNAQSHQKDTGVFASPALQTMVPHQKHPDPLSGARPPLPPVPRTETIDDAVYTNMPSSSPTQANMSALYPIEYHGKQEEYRTDAGECVPAHARDHQPTSFEGGGRAPEMEQNSSPTYNVEGERVSSTEISHPSSSSFPPQTTYEGSMSPLQGQKESLPPAPKETYTEVPGPNSFSGGIGLSFGVPPLAQQPLPPPPSASVRQEVFQPESMVDPAMFSYPYSIMDTETSGDLSYRPPRPVISWGFGGQLLTVISFSKESSRRALGNDGISAEVGRSQRVHVYNFSAITQDGPDDDWAAASEAVSPLSLPVRPPDLLTYADMSDRLAKLSVGLHGSEVEGRAAMWRVLALLCRQGTSDWRINASSALYGPSSVPTFGRSDGSLVTAGRSQFKSPFRQDILLSQNSKLQKNEAAAEVERLLSAGNGTEAIRVAQEAGLWSVALVLSAAIDRSLYMRAVSSFAKASLNDGSALQTMCLSMAEDDSEILQKATSPSGLKEWRKTVGMLLAARRASPNAGDGQHSRFLRVIDNIGEALIARRNDVVAGHICFLLSGRLGPLDSSNIPLLGADAKLPAGRPRSLGSPAVVLQSLVFEAVTNAQNGTTSPHILPFRLLLAEELCSVGRVDVSLAHCESISSAVRKVFESGRQDISSKYFTLPFLSRLEAFEQRLRVHLGLQEGEEKNGALSVLGRSLSSVFTRSLTTESKSTRTNSHSLTVEAVPSVQSRGTPQLQSMALNSSSPPPLAIPSVSPQHNVEPSRTQNLPPAQLELLPVPRTSQEMQPEPQSSDKSRNERWNSLVSKTIGFIAPAEGDLSPPLKARGDQGVPFHSQPTPLGLGPGTGNRAPGQDVHVGHLRSASVGDVPLVQNLDHGRTSYEQLNSTSGAPQAQLGSIGIPQDLKAKEVDQAVFNGVPIQKATAAELKHTATHRRSSSDMTFESQTSEKKPPRPPKKSPIPKGVELQPRKENLPAVRGWRSRLSEKIRAAFGGPPQAHMGVENKFRYDKERGRWVVEGEDPNEDDDVPLPPPEDDDFRVENRKVPFSQSYESLPNPDMSSGFMANSEVAHSQGADGFHSETSVAQRHKRYSSSSHIGYTGLMENVNSRDTGSESSVASAASAPVPFSSQPGIPPSNPGNKFRARPGRLSGRRAYVDTFNKGTPAAAISAAVPGTRPGMPSMPALSSSGSNGYRIFTPSPAASSAGASSGQLNGMGGQMAPGPSGVVESSDQTHHDGPESNNHQQTTPFGYALPSARPMSSTVNHQVNAENERQPRLTA